MISIINIPLNNSNQHYNDYITPLLKILYPLSLSEVCVPRGAQQ